MTAAVWQPGLDSCAASWPEPLAWHDLDEAAHYARLLAMFDLEMGES